MSYRWVEHTAELEMEIEASTEEGVFGDALHAMRELLASGGGDEQVWREVAVDAGDRAALLASWLDELVYFAEAEDLVPEEVGRLDLSDRGLVATVRFRRGSPRHLVKGVTYHRLAIEPSGRGYRATVVLDV